VAGFFMRDRMSDMKHRKLRIAWSVAWGVVAVLLIALWVRSYSSYDIMQGGNALGFFRADSYRGIGKLLVATSQKRDIPLTLHSSKTPGDSLPVDMQGFYFKIGNDFVSAGAPYLFHLLVISLLAIAPWLPLIRVPRRFSLRTMLIATTLAAIAMGLIVWATK
jgi:hypothetical protein